MQSKRSFFNPTLFRKNLSRTWPLWGGVSLVGSLAPLYLLLALASQEIGRTASPQDVATALYQAVTLLVPGVSFVYAALCAMLVWNYLFSARAVGMMHALPIDRTGLFITNTLSGLAMALIPYVIVGGLTCLAALTAGGFPVTAVLQAVLAVLCMTVLFFGIATLCAMVTGSLFAMPIFYALANFLSLLLDSLVRSMSQTFLVGITGAGSSPVMGWLSPLTYIYSVFGFQRVWEDGALVVQELHGLGTVAVYGLVGIALLAASWLLYRLRHSESAGDVVTFRWLRPLFRLGVALLSALTLGWLLYIALWGPFFQRGIYADAVPMAVCLSLGGALGYYIASMLLDKSLRVFRGSWKGILTVCAACAVLVLCMRLDVTGAERRVPELDQVSAISAGISGNMPTLQVDALAEPELAERILDLHRAVAEDADYIRSAGNPSDSEGRIHLNLNYTLQDGSTLHRTYSLPLTRARAAEADTYDAKALAMATDRTLWLRSKEIPRGYRMVGAEVCLSTDSADTWLEGADARRLHEAAIADLAAGRGLETPSKPEEFFRGEVSTAATVETHQALGTLQFELVDVESSLSRSIRLDLTADMTGTLAVLKDLGLLPGELAASGK